MPEGSVFLLPPKVPFVEPSDIGLRSIAASIPIGMETDTDRIIVNHQLLTARRIYCTSRPA